MDDYFADFERWLPTTLFAKLAGFAFERLIACYIEALLRTQY